MEEDLIDNGTVEMTDDTYYTEITHLDGVFVWKEAEGVTLQEPASPVGDWDHDMSLAAAEEGE